MPIEVFQLLTVNYAEGLIDTATLLRITRGVEDLPCHVVKLSDLTDKVSELKKVGMELSDALYVSTALFASAALLTTRDDLARAARENGAKVVQP